MKPPVQYVTTSDGVRIAYWTLGDGPPLILLPGLAHHLHLDWDLASIRTIYEWLSSKHTLIRFDDRGTGMSQRDVKPSFEDAARDLEAVADRNSLPTFDVLADTTSGSRAVAFAAAHPHRVSRLVLFNPVLQLGDNAVPPKIAALRAMLAVDWEMYTETTAALVRGWSGDRDRSEYARLMREAHSWEYLREWIAGYARMDLSEQLTQITAPTLIVINRGGVTYSTEPTTELVARIPGARLMLIEGSALESLDDAPAAMAAIDEFLGVSADVPPPDASAPGELPGGMAVILFADIVDSVALTERMGDAVFRERARALDDALRNIITEAGGAAIDGKLVGDGVLATFPAASQAIAAALRCAASGADGDLPLHLGLHAGDVIREANNVFGGAVNIASRISALADPGEVLVSRTVADLARTSAGVVFEDRGEQEMKGVGEPVRVYAVRAGDG